MRRPEALRLAVGHLRSIGLDLVEEPDSNGFLPAVDIRHGVLVYDPKRALPSDLLHEAGHLAVLPANYRVQAQSDISPLIERMCRETIEIYAVDSPELRAVLQSGESEATAWSYAAGVAAGLSGHWIIEPYHFDGTGRDILKALAIRCHLGVHGLVHGGMCASIRSYPELTRWLQL